MVLMGFIDRVGRAMVRVPVRTPIGGWRQLTFEIDTGAQLLVMTSRKWLEFFEAPMEPGDGVTLADGQEIKVMVGLIEIEWLGQIRIVDAIAPSRAQPSAPFRNPDKRGPSPNGLIGRSLLKNCRLTVDYGRGHVAVENAEDATA